MSAGYVRLAGCWVGWTEAGHRRNDAGTHAVPKSTRHEGQVLQAAYDGARGAFMLLVVDSQGHLHTVDAVRSGAVLNGWVAATEAAA